MFENQIEFVDFHTKRLNIGIVLASNWSWAIESVVDDVVFEGVVVVGASDLTSEVDDDDVDGVVVVVGGIVLASNWSWAIESDVDDGDDDEIVVD